MGRKTLLYLSNWEGNHLKCIDITLSKPKDIQLGFSIGLRHLCLYVLWLNIEIFW